MKNSGVIFIKKSTVAEPNILYNMHSQILLSDFFFRNLISFNFLLDFIIFMLINKNLV